MKLQKGSITMFVAFVILPIIFFLFSLSVDLSAYFTRSQRVQKVLDEAVLYAHRFLPSQTDAERALAMYIEQNAASLGSMLSSPEISSTSDSVGVLFRGRSALTFAGLFDENSPVALPYAVYSSARSAPLDVYLALDTSSYLAPDILGNEPWGTPGEWPAASFFQNERPMTKPGSAGGTVAIDPRLATGQCFNEVFSPLKLAAIQIYDHLSSFKLNSVGLGFYPSTPLDFEEVREVQKSGARLNSDGDNIGEADFNNEFGTLYQRNTYCAAAAEREQFHEPYNFPRVSKSIIPVNLCPNGSPSSMTDPTGKNFNPDYQSCLSARQVIWSRPVSSAATQDFGEAFLWLSSSLVVPKERIERGGLTGGVPKIGIILSGDLPRMNGLRYPDSVLVDDLRTKFDAIAAKVEELGVNYTMYQILFSHRGVSDEAYSTNVSSYINFLESYNSRNYSQGKFRVKLFTTDSPESVANDIISLVLLEKRRAMIADKLL